MAHHKASWCFFGEADQRQLDSLHKSATELTATQPALQTGNPFFEKLNVQMCGCFASLLQPVCSCLLLVCNVARCARVSLHFFGRFLRS